MIDIKVLASSSRGNCYRVTDSITPLMLECGISFKKIQQGLEFKTSEIKGCLVTHEHKDHCKAVKDVVKRGIVCYMSQGTKDAIGINSHRIKVIEPLKQFELGTWTIMPFDTQHDAKHPLGYLLQSGKNKVLFATDTYYIKYKFQGLTQIMIEANHSYKILDENVRNGSLNIGMKDRLVRSHFSLENVKEFLKANDLSKVEEIHLLHLSDGNSNAELFKKEIQELTGKEVYVAD